MRRAHGFALARPPLHPTAAGCPRAHTQQQQHPCPHRFDPGSKSLCSSTQRMVMSLGGFGGRSTAAA